MLTEPEIGSVWGISGRYRSDLVRTRGRGFVLEFLRIPTFPKRLGRLEMLPSLASRLPGRVCLDAPLLPAGTKGQPQQLSGKG